MTNSKSENEKDKSALIVEGNEGVGKKEPAFQP